MIEDIEQRTEPHAVLWIQRPAGTLEAIREVADVDDAVVLARATLQRSREDNERTRVFVEITK